MELAWVVDAVVTVAGGLMADEAASFGPGLEEDEALSVDGEAEMLVDAEALPKQREERSLNLNLQFRYSRNVFRETKSKMLGIYHLF